MTRRALICGLSGQDGAYLARLLLDRGYHVTGTSRDAQVASFDNLEKLGIRDRVVLESMVLTDFRSTLQTLKKAAPDEVYNLAGQSSVGLSFQQPVETMDSIAGGVLNLLESIRFLGRDIRLYNASSSECFGDTSGNPADEETSFHPRSPYAVAKAAAHWMVVNYRDAYGLYACNGILFNHESPLRPARFVTKKIVAGACAIKRGEAARLQLGNLEISRDWGAAEEYVDAMWRMMQLDQPTDLVIASGRTHSLGEFVAAAFEAVGLDWRAHVDIDDSLRRPSDIPYSAGNASKAERLIGWKAKSGMREVVAMMVEAEMAKMGLRA
ncbi:GDP-mannose 4,6-dehydratase [Phenylobacterium sp.]|uniref:GDP-mannose 4,6-dehydratase n=1 Tax=Phenylobacterium sp. TaxID=1871053 RepID=UPI0030F4894D